MSYAEELRAQMAEQAERKQARDDERMGRPHRALSPPRNRQEPPYPNREAPSRGGGGGDGGAAARGGSHAPPSYEIPPPPAPAPAPQYSSVAPLPYGQQGTYQAPGYPPPPAPAPTAPAPAPAPAPYPFPYPVVIAPPYPSYPPPGGGYPPQGGYMGGYPPPMAYPPPGGGGGYPQGGYGGSMDPTGPAPSAYRRAEPARVSFDREPEPARRGGGGGGGGGGLDYFGGGGGGRGGESEAERKKRIYAEELRAQMAEKEARKKAEKQARLDEDARFERDAQGEYGQVLGRRGGGGGAPLLGEDGRVQADLKEMHYANSPGAKKLGSPGSAPRKKFPSPPGTPPGHRRRNSSEFVSPNAPKVRY